MRYTFNSILRKVFPKVEKVYSSLYWFIYYEETRSKNYASFIPQHFKLKLLIIIFQSGTELKYLQTLVFRCVLENETEKAFNARYNLSVVSTFFAPAMGIVVFSCTLYRHFILHNKAQKCNKTNFSFRK